MARIVRGATTGRIHQFTEDNDGVVECKACKRVIISSMNLINGSECPMCHNDVNVTLGTSLIFADALLSDSDPVAKPC